MTGKLIDIVEDIGKGLNAEQLAPKPADKGEEKDGTQRTSAGKNA